MTPRPVDVLLHNLDRVVDGITRAIGRPPSALHVSLREWAMLAEELGSPAVPPDRYRGVPLKLRSPVTVDDGA